jgi:hypothetical protein
MRLIDADSITEKIMNVFEEALKTALKSGTFDLEGVMLKIKFYLDNQPTAYDVDKVVEQFESLKKIAEIMRNIDIEHNAYIEEAYERGRIYVLDEAIKIVKAGGIDD